ncbi:class I SAM-dependent methyltransferase [Leifsonia xyli]|uniref:class I SAM-dependent methyltransferase n=1 Tax=Leifsonia xyli TaxID=1575 RepID=UPI001CB8734A|nr:methyltransferase domain-containing protein [Leifsonia xyli]
MHTVLAERVAAFAELSGIHDVLDVATGTGLVLRALHSRSPSLRLTGVDLSPGMLAVARSVLPSAELIEADATVLPFPDASADLVTCVTGLHLFSRPGAALAEWVRVLRPGGRAVTATFAAMDARKHGGGCRQPFPIHHERFDSPEGWRRWRGRPVWRSTGSSSGSLVATGCCWRNCPSADGRDRSAVTAPLLSAAAAVRTGGSRARRTAAPRRSR